MYKKYDILGNLICDTFLYYGTRSLTVIPGDSTTIEELRKDRVASFLLHNSSITEAQLDTILASQIEGKLERKVSSREKKKVSKGSFVRSLRQCQSNIERSIFTLMLLGYLDIVSPEKFDQLQRTIRLLSRVKEVHPDQEDANRLVSGMEEFVSDFSGRGSKRKVIL